MIVIVCREQYRAPGFDNQAIGLTEVRVSIHSSPP